MSKPHYIRVTDAPTQPARLYDYTSRKDAVDGARRLFFSGPQGCVAQVFAGAKGDAADADPVEAFG